MPIVTFNKRYLASRLGGIDDKAMADEIGKIGMNIEKTEGKEISVEISSNRPDLIGAVGFARALQLYSHRSKKYNYGIRDHEPAMGLNVGKKVAKVRPYIAAFVVRGLNFSEESLTDLLNSMDKFTETYGRARKKIAIGMHNLDAIKGPLSYDSYENESYVPLGSNKAMTYKQVLENTEKGKRYADAIGAKNAYPALKDSQGTLALIPVLNTERTKVSVSTKNVLVDVTGPSEYMINKTADMLACIFIDMGGEVKRVQVNFPDKGIRTPTMETRETLVPVEMAEKEIGVDIGPNNVASLAAKMGYDAAYIGDKVRFKIPPYRLDVINEQDIIEDIAIAYGYDYINPLPIKSAGMGQADASAVERAKIADFMVGLGFNQMMNSYLSNDDLNFRNMRLEKDKSAVRIKNPKTEAITIMRTWLVPSLLRNISLSLNEKVPLNAFELDMAFSLKKRDPKESYHLAAVSSDPRANFNSIKAAFESIASALGIRYGLEEHNHRSFIEGRCAKVIVGGKEIGFFGEVHPEVLNAFGIDEPTVALELEL